jgi:hypothetical protein
MGTPGSPLTWDDPDPQMHWDNPLLRWGGVYPGTNIPMENNNVSAILAAQAVTNILAAVATIRTNAPFLITLTQEQRHDLPKMGPTRRDAVMQSLIFAAQNPTALPGTFDGAEFAKDGALLAPLETAAQAVESVNENIQDTLLALHNDLIMGTFEVYGFAKANNRGGAYDSYINLVKPAFARPRKTATTVTPPVTPPTP